MFVILFNNNGFQEVRHVTLEIFCTIFVLVFNISLTWEGYGPAGLSALVFQTISYHSNCPYKKSSLSNSPHPALSGLSPNLSAIFASFNSSCTLDSKKGLRHSRFIQPWTYVTGTFSIDLRRVNIWNHWCPVLFFLWARPAFGRFSRNRDNAVHHQTISC